MSASLSGFCPRACFRRIAAATCANDLPLETAGDRCEPLGSDGVWTKRGPGTPRSQGQRRSASRTLPRQGRPPPAAPDKRAPPGNRLVRGSPGGVWARDIPLCRRAVPGQCSSTPAPCLVRPCTRRRPSLSGSTVRSTQASTNDSCLQSQIGQHHDVRSLRTGQVEAPWRCRWLSAWYRLGPLWMAC